MRRQVISVADVEAAASGRRPLILSPDVLVTPAARERAQELGVRMEAKAPPAPETGSAEKLQGYFYPLTPLGKASLLDDPPWHFGGDVLFVTFRADPKAVRSLLPPQMQPGADPGLCFAWLADIISVGDQTRDMIYRNPARTHYVEGMVAVSCSFEGNQGYTVPYIWVDQDWSLARGWIFGWPKKLATCYLSRTHELNPALGPLREGLQLSGLVERHGQSLMRLGMRMNRKGTRDDVPKFGNLFMYRYFPNVQHGATPSISQILRMDVANLKVGDVWTGTGELEFFSAENEELEALRPVEILKGVYASVGWTNPGAQMLWTADGQNG